MVGEDVDQLDRGVDIGSHGAQGQSAVEGVQHGQLLAVLEQHVAEAAQESAPLAGGTPGPRRLRDPGRPHGSVDLFRTAVRNRGQFLAEARILDRVTGGDVGRLAPEKRVPRAIHRRMYGHLVTVRIL